MSPALVISSSVKESPHWTVQKLRSCLWNGSTCENKLRTMLKLRFSTLGLKVALSTRSTVTANQILKRVAMKNSIHYSKQNTAKAFRVIAALVSLGQQTSHSCNRSVSPLVM